MTTWKSILTVILMMGFYWPAFAPYHPYYQFTEEDSPFTMDAKAAELILAELLKIGPNPSIDGEQKITDYCVMTSAHLLQVCQVALHELVYPYPASIIYNEDEKYECQYVQISWTTPEYNKVGGVILPLIKCPMIKATRIKVAEPNEYQEEDLYESIERHYMLGFGRLFRVILFALKADNEKTGTESSEKSNDKRMREENSLQTSLPKGKGEESTVDKIYKADFSIITEGIDKGKILGSIKSELAPVGVYKEVMMYPHSVIRLDPVAFLMILRSKALAEMGDQVGSMSLVKPENN